MKLLSVEFAEETNPMIEIHRLLIPLQPKLVIQRVKQQQ